MTITETSRNTDSETLENAFGMYTVSCDFLTRKDFDTLISLILNDIEKTGSTRERVERMSASVKKFEFMKNRYILFAVYHSETVQHVHGAISMELVDSRGTKAGRVALDGYSLKQKGRLRSGRYPFLTYWLFITDGPVTEKLRLRAEFLPGQVVEYAVMP